MATVKPIRLLADIAVRDFVRGEPLRYPSDLALERAVGDPAREASQQPTASGPLAPQADNLVGVYGGVGPLADNDFMIKFGQECRTMAEARGLPPTNPPVVLGRFTDTPDRTAALKGDVESPPGRRRAGAGSRRR